MPEPKINKQLKSPELHREVETMTPAKYERLSQVRKKQIIEGHLALVAEYDIISHVARDHPTVAGYGPPGTEEELHRSIHEGNIDLPPIVGVNGKEVVAGYASRLN